MTFVTLTTERQTLRPMLPDDAEAMFAMHADPEVMRYVPDSGFASVEEARAFLVGYQDVYRIEGYARFTIEHMKEKLALKKRGACTCKPTDILCKTMCGTLLGPGAKDVVLHPRD